MYKLWKTLLFLLIIIFSIFSYNFFLTKRFQTHNLLTHNLLKNYVPIWILYNPNYYKDYKYILDVYGQVLKEEGVNFQLKTIDEILRSEKIDENLRGIILPDGINQHVYFDLYFFIEKCLKRGINVFLVFDVGIKDRNRRYLEKSVFSNLLGINSSTYGIYKEETFLNDNVKILDPDFLGFPRFRLEKNKILAYLYKKKIYYVSRLQIINNDYTEIAKTENYNIPFIVIKNYGKGKIYFVNTPLGYLKANSDDLILRSNLITFIDKICGINRLANIENALPTVILNYHVDANSDWKAIEFLYNNGYFRKNIKSSYHITAGDFRDKEGDKLGFDACGKGRKYVDILSKYGSIGSHGGWAHNYYSYTLIYDSDKIDIADFIERNIEMNNSCLESIVGYKIREYSAPNGVHPQPINTKILEKLGMICYYYVGDLGSAPNLTFYNNEMVSDRVLAFPVCPYKDIVSLGEMKKRNISGNEVFDFLKNFVDYVQENQTVRLYYTHPYDVLEYPMEYKKFLDYLESKINAKLIQTQTMEEYTEFFFRFLKTEFDIEQNEDIIIIELNNPDSLRGISLKFNKQNIDLTNSLILAKNYLRRKGVFLREYRDFLYLVIQKDLKYLKIVLRKSFK